MATVPTLLYLLQAVGGRGIEGYGSISTGSKLARHVLETYSRSKEHERDHVMVKRAANCHHGTL